MTQAKPKLRTFQDFLAYDDGSDRRYELLTNGELIELPPESELNSWIAKVLGMALEKIVSPRLVRTNSITLEVEPFGDDRKNRYPDLIVLQPEHIPLMAELGYGAITLGMPAPQMVAEVVSPGSETSDNYRRDYDWKRQQYQVWGIAEYWILDSQRAQVTVLALIDGAYQAKNYNGDQPIISAIFPKLKLTTIELLES
ncbi:MAG: Uma2 family endonuclease [Pseudanabaenales cyanobacterium]|nr:Uma2 family endonuclease [Pseudanabaenales cyanobacterium]